MTAPHTDPFKRLGQLLAEARAQFDKSPTLPQCLLAAAQKRKESEK